MKGAISGYVFEQLEIASYTALIAAAQVVGFTDIDNNGSEGVELAYDQALRGISGRQHVVKDRKGQVIQDLGVSRPARQGQDLALSLDIRLQYLASPLSKWQKS